MSTPGLLSRIFGTASYTAEVDTCAICLEKLDSTKEIHETPCGHQFHSECYIAYLLKEDIRCPLCRKYPDPTDERNADEVTADGLDEAEEGVTRVSRKEAWTNACKSLDKKVKHSLVTIQKWKDAAKKARNTLVQLDDVLQHKEGLIDEKVRLFHRKLTAEHEYKHAVEITQKKQAEQDLARANRVMGQVKMRLLKKFGFRQYRFRSRRRRR